MKVLPQLSIDTEESGGEEPSLHSFSKKWDMTIGNVPFISCIGLVMTIACTAVFGTQMNHCQHILSTYHGSTSHWVVYSNWLLACMIVLHTAIFGHGWAVGALETSREMFHAKQVGCQKCPCHRYTQVGCQWFWGIVGTVSLFVIFVCLLGVFSVSSMSTVIAYLFVHTCHHYSAVVSQQIGDAETYLHTAKQYIGKADNVTRQFLMEYNRFIELKDTFRSNAMNELSEIETPTFTRMKWSPERMPRRLTFDPRASLLEGQSTIHTLNATITQTEHQLAFYKKEFDHSVAFCLDYGGLHDALMTITISTVVLLCAHLVMFGAHSKYFSKWYYEAKLIEDKNYT